MSIDAALLLVCSILVLVAAVYGVRKSQRRHREISHAVKAGTEKAKLSRPTDTD